MVRQAQVSTLESRDLLNDLPGFGDVSTLSARVRLGEPPDAIHLQRRGP
jgi:hypothetical protein